MKLSYNDVKRFVMYALLTGINIVLCIVLAIRLNIWVDEAFTLNTTGNGIKYAFLQAIGFESQPPLYFVILALIRSLSTEIIFARMLSIVFAVGTLFLTVPIIKRYLPTTDPLPVYAFFAINPYLIWSATEIRLYSKAIFMSALLILLFDMKLLCKTPKWIDVIVIAAAAIVAIYTHYFLAFFLVAFGLVLIFVKEERISLIRFVIMCGVVVIAFIPMLFIVPEQLYSVSSDITKMKLFNSLTYNISRVVEYVVFTSWAPLTIDRVLKILFTGFAAVATVVVFKKKITKQLLSILIMVGTILCFFIILGILWGPARLAMRHTYPLFVISTLLFFGLMKGLSDASSKVVFWTTFSIVAFFCVIHLVILYSPMAKHGDYRRASEYIEDNEIPGEPVLLFNAETELPMRHYYTGLNKLVPIPRSFEFDKWDTNRLVLKNTTTVIDILVDLQEPDRLWYYTNFVDGYGNIKYGREVLENYIFSKYKVSNTKNYFHARVMYLQKKSKNN